MVTLFYRVVFLAFIVGVCPKGKAIGDLPSKSNKAHAAAECSNQGICDRSNGTCSCFPPFQGIACERSKVSDFFG